MSLWPCLPCRPNLLHPGLLPLRGFVWSASLLGMGWGLLEVDFAGAVHGHQANGTSMRPGCPPGWVPTGRVCCSAQQVRAVWRGCSVEGASAAELVLVPLPHLHPGSHRGHPSGFSLPTGAGKSLQKLLPGP